MIWKRSACSSRWGEVNRHTLSPVEARGAAAGRLFVQQHPDLWPVTEVELATAAGFLYFHHAGVDLVVLKLSRSSAVVCSSTRNWCR